MFIDLTIWTVVGKVMSCVLKYLESLTKLVSTEAKLVKFYSWPFFSLYSSVTLAAPDMSVDHTTLCSCQCPHLSDYPFFLHF